MICLTPAELTRTVKGLRLGPVGPWKGGTDASHGFRPWPATLTSTWFEVSFRGGSPCAFPVMLAWFKTVSLVVSIRLHV